IEETNHLRPSLSVRSPQPPAGTRPAVPHNIDERTMSRKDDLTGRGPRTGNHVSHANNKAKRRFSVNLQKKRFYIPEQDRWVTLKVSTKTLKTINKNGIQAVIDEARRQGVRV